MKYKNGKVTKYRNKRVKRAEELYSLNITVHQLIIISVDDNTIPEVTTDEEVAAFVDKKDPRRGWNVSRCYEKKKKNREGG